MVHKNDSAFQVDALPRLQNRKEIGLLWALLDELKWLC